MAADPSTLMTRGDCHWPESKAGNRPDQKRTEKDVANNGAGVERNQR